MQRASLRRILSRWSTAVVLTLVLLGCGAEQQNAMAPPPAMPEGNSAQSAGDEGVVVEPVVIASDAAQKEAADQARARAHAEMEAQQRQRAESQEDRSRAAAQVAAERQARAEAESAAARRQAEAVGIGSIMTNGKGMAKIPTVAVPPIVVEGAVGKGPGGMGTSGSGVGGGGYGGLGSFGSGIGGRGYGAGPKGSGGALVGGSARWEVAPFTEEAGWLDGFPELRASGKDYGKELTHMVKRLLRLRMVNATASNEVLTPERLEQLVDEGVKYLCDGKLKKLQASGDGEQLELKLVYRLRRVVGGEKFRLVHIRPLSTLADKAAGSLSVVTNRLLFDAAQQVVNAVLRDMPADMNAIRG